LTGDNGHQPRDVIAWFAAPLALLGGGIVLALSRIRATSAHDEFPGEAASAVYPRAVPSLLLLAATVLAVAASIFGEAAVLIGTVAAFLFPIG
ncbi:unnamed protein product, partial [Amoebophrya sp. A120]